MVRVSADASSPDPESVVPTSPLPSAQVFGDVAVSGGVFPTDASGSVALVVDGTVVSETAIDGGSFAFTWDSTQVDDGPSALPWFVDTTYTTIENEYGPDADLAYTSWANGFTSSGAALWDASYNNPTDGSAHARVESVAVPAPLVIADAVACSDGTSYSARAIEGGEVEVGFDVASSPVANGSAAVEVTFDAFSADGSLIASSSGAAMSVGSTYARVSSTWTPPADTYWVRVAIEVSGDNGGDPIIWRIDRADMAVRP